MNASSDDVDKYFEPMKIVAKFCLEMERSLLVLFSSSSTEFCCFSNKTPQEVHRHRRHHRHQQHLRYKLLPELSFCVKAFYSKAAVATTTAAEAAAAAAAVPLATSSAQSPERLADNVRMLNLFCYLKICLFIKRRTFLHETKQSCFVFSSVVGFAAAVFSTLI